MRCLKSNQEALTDQIGDIIWRCYQVAGKPKKVALTACMRKLLVILNTMVKNNQHWKAPCAAPNPGLQTQPLSPVRRGEGGG